MRLRSASAAFLCVSSLRAFEPVEREQPSGRKLRPDVRHADEIDALRASRDRARRASPRADSRAPRARARAISLAISVVSITGSMRRWIANSQSSCCRSASTADCMSGYCSLQASALPSSERARCTWPSEAAAAGLCSNSRELVLPAVPKLGHHAPLDERPAHRRRIALQLLQFLDVFGRQQVRNGRHQLGDLHDRTFEPAKRRRQVRRVPAAIEAKGRTAGSPRISPRRHPHWCRRGRSAPRGRRSGFSRGRRSGALPCPANIGAGAAKAIWWISL